MRNVFFPRFIPGGGALRAFSRAFAVRAALCGLLAVFAAGPLAAQETPPRGEAAIPIGAPRSGEAAGALSPGASTASPAFRLLRGVLALALVAAGTYGAVLFIKRSKAAASGENPRLKVLASAPINARAQVAVVAVGGKAFLLGVGETSVSLIAELDDKETVDGLMLDYSREGRTAAGRLGFKAMLAALGARARPPAAAAPSVSTPPSAAVETARRRLEAL